MEALGEPLIKIEERGDCLLLTLNRPDVHNALSFELLDSLDRALDEAAASRARALIITGAGERAFCAGADIKKLIGRPLLACKAGSARGQAVLQKLEDLSLMSIALINGYAFGGGLEIALACTFRLAVPRAKMGLPEIKLGLIPGYGGTQRLSRLIGHARAMEMILTGAVVDAATAHSTGLIHRIVDGDPVEAALRYAAEFTGYSLAVLRLARDSVQRSAETFFREGLKCENELSTLAYSTEDSNEGMRAFIEKRRPRFNDH